MKENTDKLDPATLKSFCSMKDSIGRMQSQSEEWKNIFAIW